MEQSIKLWCEYHPSITDYSIPNIPVLITEKYLMDWELREEDRNDFQDWFPIYNNCTGVNYNTYYYNLNKNSQLHGKILGMWCHCFSGEVEVKMIAQSVEKFLANPKYANMISRRNDYHGGLKVSFMSG